MITIKDKSDCCGCSACTSVCGHQAITMKPDGIGFLYPEVDRNKCVDCGLCNQVCAFHANYDISRNLPKPDVYAVRHKDMSEITTSRSGAVFIALSDWILELDMRGTSGLYTKERQISISGMSLRAASMYKAT